MGSGAPSIVWFRRDLRVADHPALARAAGLGPVACVWIRDPRITGRRHHQAPNRLRFLRAGLAALDRELGELGGSLTLRRGAPEQVLVALAAEIGATRILATREVSPLGRDRDARVGEKLAAAGIDLELVGGDLLAEPEDLAGIAGHGYLVFTPFFRAWSQIPVPGRIAPPALEGVSLASDGLDLPAGEPLIPAGPAAARDALVRFIRDGGADAYADGRNDLAADATSRLSPYLRFGMCTAAQIGRALGLPGKLSPGRAAVWRQIAWREFYHHHLRRHPEVARVALRAPLRNVRWESAPDDLAAWERGETGYPLVDAGMRQLAGEGWVHNRARMIVASFLVKDLLIDWRRGETVFMRHLLDGDPASNNGGWQWTAGTGTDAAPYFRILNPTTQARRFDPQGTYIRRWVPELRGVPTARIHEPWTMTADEEATAGCRIGTDYPAPRVDHGARREAVLARYREASEAA